MDEPQVEQQDDEIDPLDAFMNDLEHDNPQPEANYISQPRVRQKKE
jgi:hypothetical protein